MPCRSFIKLLKITLLIAGMLAGGTQAQAGHATHEDLLLGFHFNFNRPAAPKSPAEAYVSFPDFVKYQPEDLARISYADWWVSWNMAERYKGDELGLRQVDEHVNAALDAGLKVKTVLIFSSWWTNDIDWSTTTSMGGAPNADEYASWCGRYADYFRGRMATIDLQGEANSGDYWKMVPNLTDPMAHIADVYIKGAKAIRKADPEVLIGVADVTPGLGGINQLGEPISKENILEWYRYHLTAAKGTYDIAMINYFADIDWADPFGSGWVYYKTIRDMLDELGEHEVEIGSGESSVEWAASSWDLKWPTERQQAWRLNETLGKTYTDGMTKWMWHGLPQEPGAGWIWRWGWSKYQDHWGVWPETSKIPGTKIVYAAPGNPKAKEQREPVDLRGAWSRPADPRLPVTEIFDFWSQAFPNGSSAVKLPIEVWKPAEDGGSEVYRLGSYLRTRDEAVALIYTTNTKSLEIVLDLARTGWNEGTLLQANLCNETIDLATGDRTVNAIDEPQVKITEGKQAHLSVPHGNDWTTVRLVPVENRAEVTAKGWPEKASTRSRIAGSVTLRNSGKVNWPLDAVLGIYPDNGRGHGMDKGSGPNPTGEGLRKAVQPGSSHSFGLEVETASLPQRQRFRLRLFSANAGWFGPVVEVFTDLTDARAPREFVALREAGHVRLGWFAPEAFTAESYEIARAEGIDGEEQVIAQSATTEYVDASVKADTEYYYRVTAIGAGGERGGTSRRDNARGSTKARIWDAEVISHTVPAALRRGESGEASVTLRNTGSRAWKSAGTTFWMQTAQLWDERNEANLPKVGIPLEGEVAPGGEITLKFPYVAPAAGEFANHWVMRMSTEKVGAAWFGSPLRVMTTVRE